MVRADAAILALLPLVVERCAERVVGYINPDPDGNSLPHFASAEVRNMLKEMTDAPSD